MLFFFYILCIVYITYYKLLVKKPSSGGLEPPTFRLTVERTNRLRHEDPLIQNLKEIINFNRLHSNITALQYNSKLYTLQKLQKVKKEKY